MKILKFVCVSLLITLINSCKVPADVVYFQGVENLEKISIKDNETSVFRTDDVISVFVSAPDMDTARPFNLSQGLTIEGDGTQGQNQVDSAPTYVIDSEGNIEFPVLGKLKISGLTRVEAASVIKEKIKEFINAPVVTVKLKNFKITVLGEVNNPGSLTVETEKITVIEAIGIAGDLTIKGKRQNITVIRDLGKEKEFHKLDITSKEIFNSPAYYLNQNDIVYVEPNTSRVRTSKTNNNTLSIALTIFGVVLSAISIL